MNYTGYNMLNYKRRGTKMALCKTCVLQSSPMFFTPTVVATDIDLLNKHLKKREKSH